MCVLGKSGEEGRLRQEERREEAAGEGYVLLLSCTSPHAVHGLGGQVKEESIKQSKAGLDSLPYLERGCLHQPGVLSHEREFSCPAWRGERGKNHANSISWPGLVPGDGDRLRGGGGAVCRRARAGHWSWVKGLQSASPAGA